MKFWIALFISLTFFSANVLPGFAHAKASQVEKTQKSKKSSKKSSKKASSKKSKKASNKKSAKKKKSSRSSRAAAAAAPAYSPRYAEFLVDGETGRILHQEDANEKRYPASLTKLMTIYLTFEQIKAGHIRFSDNLRVSPYAASMPKTNMSLTPGSRITVKEAVLGLIVHSANDASVVLAENISGDEDTFAKLMTERAHQLGMKSTYFKNACGLHNPGQVTTAKDMALLAIALKKHYPEYYDMFQRTSFEYNGRDYNGHNRVTSSYRGAEGLKTGYVRASGFNLVTSATRYEGNLVGVVIGGRTAAGRDQRMKDLLDAGFEKLASNKKKDKFASKPTDYTSELNITLLEPASGGNINGPDNGSMLKPEAEVAEPLNAANDNEKLAVSKAVKPAKPVAEASKKTKNGNIAEAKHFTDGFIPKPKGKPRTAS